MNLFNYQEEVNKALPGHRIVEMRNSIDVSTSILHIETSLMDDDNVPYRVHLKFSSEFISKTLVPLDWVVAIQIRDNYLKLPSSGETG